MPSPSSNSQLKKSAIRGGIITMSAQMASISIQLASIVVLSRLLPAEDFGVIAMITAITAFMGLFRDMGLSTAAIQSENLKHEQINTLFWLNVAAGFILSLLILASSPAVAWFYKHPELQPLTAFLSLTFIFSSAGAQHAALMQRDLQFRPKAIAEVLGALASLLVSIALAVLGWRYWSLAWGTVVGSAVTTILYFWFSKFRPSRPGSLMDTRKLLGFGAHVTGFELVNYCHRNLDKILIGRFWGAVELGLYSRAYQMMMLPITSLRTPINAVAFPLLSRLKNEPNEFRRYYCNVATVLAFISMPLMAFLTTNANDVVTVALGSQWNGVVPIVVLLGITGFIQPVASLRGLVMLSLGRSNRYLQWGIFNAVAVSIAFCIGTKWGSEGVAFCYAISNYLILYPSMTFAFKDTPLRSLDFFRTALLPASASIFAGIINYVAHRNISDLGPVLRLATSGLIFFCSFFLFILIIPSGRKTLRNYYRLIISAFEKKISKPNEKIHTQ